MPRRLAIMLCLPAVLSLSGCYISKSDNKDGSKDNVAIQTPLGGMHIKTDNLKAVDVGLPEYPGATRVAHEGSDNQSADINFSFGSFQLHVKAMGYQSTDPQQKVIAFYKKALGRYGDVIQCQDHQPVGTPTRTAEGLTCAENSKNIQVRSDMDSNAKMELKAGSRQHQHIVSFDHETSSGTKFGLVSLDLPKGMESNESN